MAYISFVFLVQQKNTIYNFLYGKAIPCDFIVFIFTDPYTVYYLNL